MLQQKQMVKRINHTDESGSKMRTIRIMHFITLQLYVTLVVVGAFSFAPIIHHTIQKRGGVLHSTKESQTSKHHINEKAPINNCVSGEIKKPPSSTINDSSPPPTSPLVKRKMELTWCNHDSCYEAIREKVVGEHNHMELTGPATGQVVYRYVFDICMPVFLSNNVYL